VRACVCVCVFVCVCVCVLPQVLDTARVFPPSRVHTSCCSMTIPASDKLPIDVALPVPRRGPTGPSAIAAAFRFALVNEARALNDATLQQRAAAAFASAATTPTWTMARCGRGVVACLHPPSVPDDLAATLAFNERASRVMGRRVVGPALWLHSQKGEHLVCLLRPELLASNDCPLVSEWARWACPVRRCIHRLTQCIARARMRSPASVVLTQRSTTGKSLPRSNAWLTRCVDETALVHPTALGG